MVDHDEHHEDDEEHHRHHDLERLLRPDLVLVLPRPLDEVSWRELEFPRQVLPRLVDEPPHVPPAHVQEHDRPQEGVLRADHRRSGRYGDLRHLAEGDLPPPASHGGAASTALATPPSAACW